MLRIEQVLVQKKDEFVCHYGERLWVSMSKKCGARPEDEMRKAIFGLRRMF